MASRRARLEALFPNPKSKAPAAKPPTAEEKGKSITVGASWPKPPVGLTKKPGTLVIGGPTVAATAPTKKSTPTPAESKRKAMDYPEDRRPPKMVKLPARATSTPAW